jgi:hypothetical protein
MLEKNQQFGVYTIKEILYTNKLKTCCLTEDPFFHSAVILNVIDIKRLLSGSQLHNLESFFDKLHLLEHEGIATLYDSGYEGNFFYYTTSYNHLKTLTSHAESLTVPDIKKLLRELVESCAYAEKQNLSHGRILLEDIYFNDEGRALIVDFGVRHIFSQLIENRDTSVSISESLGHLLLQLLTSVVDLSEHEQELLNQLRKQPVTEIVSNYFGFKRQNFTNFNELHGLLIKNKDINFGKNTKKITRKTPHADDGIISIREKNQLLPEVRKLISEKNQLIKLLDKASLEKNRINNQLSKALKKIEELQDNQNINSQESEKNKPFLVYALVCFFVGVLVAGFWGNKNVASLPVTTPRASASQPAEHIEEVELKKIDVDAPEVSEPIAETKADTEEPVTMSKLSPTIIPEPLIEEPLKSNIKTEEEPVWWPSGEEFSEEAQLSQKTFDTENIIILKKNGDISSETQATLLKSLQGWSDAWSHQNIERYLSYYGQVFSPKNEQTFSKWKETRRRKLERPDWIKINIQNITIERQNSEQIQVTFEQTYHSDSYEDKVVKRLQMVQEDYLWKIASEETLSILEL